MLPTVRFSESGEIDAAHAAHVVQVGSKFIVHVRYADGGYMPDWWCNSRDAAESRADEINTLIGGWAKLGGAR